MSYLLDRAVKRSGSKAAPSLAKSSSHDTKPPPKLLQFMMTNWRGASNKPVKPLKAAAAHAARRRALSALFPGDTLVIPTGHEKIRANDTVYRFRPGSDFFYLTGNLEPDCVLVLVPKGRRGHVSHLFVEPNPGRSDATFFTNRAKGELWVGPRLGIAGSKRKYRIEHTHPLERLDDFLAARGKTRLLRGIDGTLDAEYDENVRDSALAAALSELRLFKDPAEIGELKAVIASTQRGFEDVIARVKRAKSEREVEGVFALRARVEGNDVGYGTIAAAGAHACILHWTHNDGALKRGDLLLLDAGVEGHSLYTADITRTLPLNGKFSLAQRDIYALVWLAQQAALRAVKPGNDFMEPNRRAQQVLAQGLERLGILPTTAEEALKDEHQFHKRYSLHNVSHMLGLDVHDCAKARAQAYKLGPLKPGMVLTVEPGLYFQKDDLTVPVKYRGIGVRIEDDVLVTRTGFTNLSKSIPSSPDAVEKWMKRVWRKARR